MSDITRFQTTLLAAAAADDGQSGKEIAGRVERAHGVSVSNGRLYPSLDGLVDAGLIDQRDTDGRANAHTVTDRGMRHLRARLDFLLSATDANPRYDLTVRLGPDGGVDLDRTND